MKLKQLRNLVCAGLLGSSILFCGVSEAGVVTDRLPLQCYADHQVNTYNSPGAAKRAGYISANVDLIKITQVRGDGWCYGSYPGAGGKRVSRWFRITDVCADAGYSNRSANVRGNQTVYRTRSGGATLGSVSNNESVIVVADNGNRAQIVYRLDNGTGYKLGWVPSAAVAAAPNPVHQGYNPQGNFEGVSSPAANQIRVEGWAADRDNMRESLRIHVYVGGGAGSGAESYEIVANKSRPDVRDWFGRQGIPAGEFYGFNNVINVKRTGRQEVYVYAINVGGGNTVELGHKTVDIKGINVKKGDMNGDGTIDKRDADILEQCFLNKQWTAQQLAAGDFDGNGKINLKDVSQLELLLHSNKPIDYGKQVTAERTVYSYNEAALQNKIGRVDKGDMVTILQESGNAYRVEYPIAKGTKVGWVTKDIFKKEDNNTKIDAAMRYIASFEGKSMDYDGAYGAQCVDLIKYYYNYFGVPQYAKGNGKDYANNALPPGWQRIKAAVPQKGDILVYTTGGGGYGHVAIAESTNVSWHQNYNGKYVRKITGNYKNIHVGYWGIIRPNV